MGVEVAVVRAEAAGEVVGEAVEAETVEVAEEVVEVAAAVEEVAGEAVAVVEVLAAVAAARRKSHVRVWI